MKRKTTHPLIPGTSFYLAAAMLFFGIWHIGRLILHLTSGHFVYGLDDPYIHLSIARTLVEHGIYGVTPAAVSFASSSVLWPLILAGVSAVTGGLLLLPFIFNVIAALGCLWIIEAMGKREGLSAAGRFMIMFFFILVTPVQPLIFLGMEHVAHLFSVLIVLYTFLGLNGEKQPIGRQVLMFCATIAFSVLLRYETLFFAIVLAALLAYRRQFRLSMFALLSAALPVMITGLIMLSSGGYFLSNSLLVKGPVLVPDNFIRLHSFLYFYLLWPETQAVYWRLIYLAVFVIGVLFVLPDTSRIRQFRYLLYAVLGAIGLHVLAIRVDHFNRYTAYIVGSGLTVTLLAFVSSLNGHVSLSSAIPLRRFTTPLILIAMFTLFPLLMDGVEHYRNAPSISRNIYEQQYQMSRFLSRYYSGEAVAINDLGLAVYDGHIQPVDLAGLADPRVAISRRNKTFTIDDVRIQTREHGVGIAVLYRSWFQQEVKLPDEWIPVEEWILQDNIICGSDTLNFYGITSNAADTLRQRLRRFHKELPARVIIRQISSAQ